MAIAGAFRTLVVVKGFDVRRIYPLLSIVALAGLLVACGGGDDEDEPTVISTIPVIATEIDATSTVAAIDEATTIVVSPEASGDMATTIVASPETSGDGSVMVASSASPEASPLAETDAALIVPPVVDVATPAASAEASPVIAGAVPASDDASDATRQFSGTVTLPGAENESYVIVADGCVGLGKYSGVQVGQQVVVKDETGTIVGVSSLAANDSQSVCSWSFDVEVPMSNYYTVSLPLVAEHVFSDEDVVRLDGGVNLDLP